MENHNTNQATAHSIPGGGDGAEWLRVKECAAKFGMSRSKLYQLAKMGLIKSASLKVGSQKLGIRLFDAQSIRDYIQSCVVEVGA